METPTISYFVAFMPERRPRDEPRLALRAAWSDGHSRFLIQNLQPTPDLWCDSPELWEQIEMDCAPMEVQTVDKATFLALCERQGVEPPTVTDWHVLRQSPHPRDLRIFRPDPTVGRNGAGPELA